MELDPFFAVTDIAVDQKIKETKRKKDAAEKNIEVAKSQLENNNNLGEKASANGISQTNATIKEEDSDDEDPFALVSELINSRNEYMEVDKNNHAVNGHKTRETAQVSNSEHTHSILDKNEIEKETAKPMTASSASDSDLKGFMPSASDKSLNTIDKMSSNSNDVKKVTNSNSSNSTNHVAGNSHKSNTTTSSPKPKIVISKPSIAAPTSIDSNPSLNITSTQQTNSLELANDEIAALLHKNHITQNEVSSLQAILRENSTLKEKISKLKLLLSRSAKASKEHKNDLEQHRRLLANANREIEALQSRVENLANRPTHMDILADFETNFDRAMLHMNHTHVQQQQQQKQNQKQQQVQYDDYSINHHESTLQSGGEDPQSHSTTQNHMTGMIANELTASQERISRLESNQKSLNSRLGKLDKQNQKLMDEKNGMQLKMSNLQLELRMAKMETENATRALKEKAASLAEMQLEIDLVTRSAMNANVRAAAGMEAVKSVKTDRAHVEELEAKVSALQEWAVASATAKEVALQRCDDLEERLETVMSRVKLEMMDQVGGVSENLTNSSNGHEHLEKGDQSDQFSSKSDKEKILWTDSSSLVVGAGMIQSRVVELGKHELSENETVLLRWKFDINPSDVDIYFSILKGRCEDKSIMHKAQTVMKDRHVMMGGGGEVQGAFAIQNCCTLVWSNEHSWVRPRSIRYVLEAVAVL